MYDIDSELDRTKFARDMAFVVIVVLLVVLVSALTNRADAGTVNAGRFNTNATLDTSARQIAASGTPGRVNPDAPSAKGWACVTGWSDDMTRGDKLRFKAREALTLGRSTHVLTTTEHPGAVSTHSIVKRGVKLHKGEVLVGACKFDRTNRAQYNQGEVWTRAQLALVGQIESYSIKPGAMTCQGVKPSQANAWVVRSGDAYAFASKAKAQAFAAEYGADAPMMHCKIGA